MKPLSKRTLRIINFFFKISLAKEDVRALSIDYIKQRAKGLSKFNISLLNQNFKSESDEFISMIDLYETATNFRSNKKLIKALIEGFIVTPLLVLTIIIPGMMPSYFSEIKFGFWQFALIYLISIGGIFTIISGILSVSNFIENFEVKIGKTLTRMIQLVSFLSFSSLAYYCFKMDDGFVRICLLSIYGMLFVAIIFSIINYVLSEILVDAIFFSKKIQITDALIIESSFRLSQTNWSNAVKKRKERQMALVEIERLALLIEKDWSGHILPGDEKTNKWKVNTLKGIASSFRKIKRKIIIPSSETPLELEQKFNSIFHKIMIHDLQGLMDEEVPAARIRKRSFVSALQSFIVAILPIALALCIKLYASSIMDESYLHITLILSGLWLLISLLIWLDPNIADKISTVKSVRSMFNSKDD